MARPAWLQHFVDGWRMAAVRGRVVAYGPSIDESAPEPFFFSCVRMPCSIPGDYGLAASEAEAVGLAMIHAAAHAAHDGRRWITAYHEVGR